MICMSQTGNTKKVAEAISQEIRGEEEIKPMSEVSDLDGCDLAFVGRGTWMVSKSTRVCFL